MLRELAMLAREADIHFTVDAEEADRLELSMDIIEALVADDALFAGGWEGFGLAIQAYQKRALPLVDWTVALARRHGRRLMVRLVKGAYWDTEIKLSQVGGLRDYPVFTRKVATDVSYLACAERLLAGGGRDLPRIRHPQRLYDRRDQGACRSKELEFQRLHGMGEDIYEELAEQEEKAGEKPTPVRIYAPVGGHKDLLAYLVRRLLENGANSSFVNRMADAEVPVEELITDPVARSSPRSNPMRNPAIPLPAEIFPGRLNSAGVDLADPLVREPLMDAMASLAGRQWEAGPTLGKGGKAYEIISPQDDGAVVGTCRDATTADVEPRLRSRQSRTARLGRAWRRFARRAARGSGPTCSRRTPTDFICLCQREAGKTLLDSVLEVREAVDFLRYYADAGAARIRPSAPAARADRRGELPAASTAAACSSPSPRGTSRWRSSPACRPPRWPRATACSPSPPSRPR